MQINYISTYIGGFRVPKGSQRPKNGPQMGSKTQNQIFFQYMRTLESWNFTKWFITLRYRLSNADKLYFHLNDNNYLKESFTCWHISNRIIITGFKLMKQNEDVRDNLCVTRCLNWLLFELNKFYFNISVGSKVSNRFSIIQVYELCVLSSL